MSGSRTSGWSARNEMRIRALTGIVFIILVLVGGYLFGVGYEAWMGDLTHRREMEEQALAAERQEQVERVQDVGEADATDAEPEAAPAHAEEPQTDPEPAQAATTAAEQAGAGASGPYRSQSPELTMLKKGQTVYVGTSFATLTFDAECPLDIRALQAMGDGICEKAGSTSSDMRVVAARRSGTSTTLAITSGDKRVMAEVRDGTDEGAVTAPTDDEWKEVTK